ncbi:UNVERIFIED_CONTAM: hypothetical protein Sradi_6212800 [Sesamum radiatum]|uniref:Uncharacterized protein n=1 Tax=Sesamum radiatum TaxID=300843 RepID=A0AAW2KAG0_SESRA
MPKNEKYLLLEELLVPRCWRKTIAKKKTCSIHATKSKESVVTFLLQDYEDVFPDETPLGLPPIRGIEHQIDFIPRASLLNRPAYRTNPRKPRRFKDKSKNG